MTLADYIKKLRGGHKVDKSPTLEEVSAATGLSLSCIHNIETGIVKRPIIATLKSLADYYDVPLNSMIDMVE